MDNVKPLEYYQERAEYLIERDAQLRELQKAMDRMVHLEYELPQPLRALKWMRTVTTTAPYDAYRAGRRVLSKLDERIRIHPVTVLKAVDEDDDEGQVARRKANHWERTLLWHMNQAYSRKPVIRADVIGSALRYDEVVGQIIHIPTQMKAIKALGGHRKEAILRGGEFAVKLVNPKDIHVTYSDYMLESVCYVTVLTAKEIVEFWGEQAKSLKAKIASKPEYADVEHVIFDYSDVDARAVWAYEGLGEAQHESKLYKILPPEENPYPFIPWVCAIGGTTLDPRPEDQREPLMYPVYKSEQWITANVLGSLTASQAIAEMGTPKIKKVGPAPESIESTFGEPGGAYEAVTPHDVVAMPQAVTDPQLRELYDRFMGDMERATMPRILVTTEALAGETLGGYNLRLQTALGTLLPYKGVAERWYERAYTQMLYWCHYTGTNLDAFGDAKDDYGKKYVIDSEDIDPETIQLSVELSADVPTDRMGKINAAVLMSQQLKWPTKKILEELGDPDPEESIREYAKEQLFLAKLEGAKQLILMEASQAIQQLGQQIAQEQMEKMGAPMGAQPQGPGPEMTQGMPGVEGQGFNPAAGGTPPAMVNPMGATFEAQRGVTRGGAPIG